MPKLNRTLRFMVDREPDMVSPVHPSRPDSKHVGGYCISDKGESISEQEFAELLTKRPKDAGFFLDAGFIPNFEMRADLCQVLLNRCLWITPGTWRELQPWLDKPHYNRPLRDILLSAKKNGHSNVIFLDPIDMDDSFGRGVWYYVRLLSIRKEAHHVARQRFERFNGREPNEHELEASVQSLVGRGLVLARKGRKDKDKPNFFVDEEVVVRAILTGLTSGRPTEILTRDTDLIEQFYKATYLLDTHYRSMLFGRAYAKQPFNFPEADPPDVPVIREVVDWESARLIKKHDKGEYALLPKNGRTAPVLCTCLGGPPTHLKHTFIFFAGHREMVEVFRIKGATGGLSTDVLDGRNIHICIHPEENAFDGYALIGRDRRHEEGGIGWSPIDAELALRSRERCDGQVLVDPPKSFFTSPGSFGMALAELGPPTRLGLHYSPVWKNTTCEELAAAITWHEPRGRFFADRSILEAPLPAGVIKALVSRRLFTSESVVDGALASCGSGAFIKAGGMTGKHGFLRAWRLPINDVRTRPAYDHYVALLNARRAFGRIVSRSLEERLSKEPTEEEWRNEVLSYKAGDRRLLRAASGLQSGPTVFETDLLLVYAAMTAVIEGMPVTVLTRDPATFEQFSSLTQFMADDYRAWAISERMKDDIPDAEPDNAEFEKLGWKGCPTIRLLNLGNNPRYRPPSFREMAIRVNDWLPKHAISTPLACWLLDGMEPLRVYVGSFGLERPMHQLFDIKRDTGGQNTNRFGSRNAHLFAMTYHGRECVSLWVGENTQTKIGSLDFPGDDYSHLEIDELPTFSLVRMQNHSDPYVFPWHMSAD